MSKTHSYLDPVMMVDYTDNQSMQATSQFIFSTIRQETLAIIDRCQGDTHVPVEVWNAFSFLIRAREIIAIPDPNDLNPDRCKSMCQRTFQALNHLYHPQGQPLSKSEERSLSALFSLDIPRFNQFLNNVVPEHRDEARHTLSDLFQKSAQSCLKELTLNTDFADCVLDRKCPILTDLLLKQFKSNPDLFNTFMMADNPYLTQRYQQTKDEVWYGYDHILENRTFAVLVRDTIPPERWGDTVMMAIGCNALHTDATPADMTAFIRKIEHLPTTQYQSLFNLMAAVFLETDADERTRYNPKNLLPLLTRTTSPALLRQAAAFFNKLPSDLIHTVLDQPISKGEYVDVLSVLSRTHKGRLHLLKMKTPSGESLVWDLFNKSYLPADTMSRLLDTAMDTHNLPFLQTPKAIPLTPSFPAYQHLCAYFKNTTQGLRFIQSFSNAQVTPDNQLQCLSDFMPDLKMRLPAAYMLGLVTDWAHRNKSRSILSFFFDGDVENLCRLTPKMSPEQMARFLTRPDAHGRTAWHYFCLNRDRTFFSRPFKELHPSFLRICTQPDESGTSPLDLIAGDLKFCQNITEKIPMLSEKLSETGRSMPPMTTSGTRSKPQPTLAVDPPPPVPTADTPVTVAHQPVEHWHICECRHDKNRRDPIYQALIRAEVDRLPPPQCQATNMASDQLEKKIRLGTTVFKIWYNHRHWRIPFVMGHRTKTLYILPGSDRNDVYTNLAYCRLIRHEVERIHRLEMQRE